MQDETEFSPPWVVAPGRTISHALEDRRIGTVALAAMLGRSPQFVLNLLIGREEITEELANGLSSSIGSTPRFWLNRDRDYRRSLEQLVVVSPNLRNWASKLPQSEMRRLGWIRASSGDRSVLDCAQFFGVVSEDGWRERYEEAVVGAAFRSSASFENSTAAVAAWLRRGEIEAASVSCAPWSPEELRQRLPSLRALTRMKSAAQFFPVLQETCATAGVVVLVVPAPRECRASGVARFLPGNRALIQLSRRYAMNDQFWFTFFHEVGHLLLHAGNGICIDDEGFTRTPEEDEANEFASNVLLTPEQRQSLSGLPKRYREVIRFSRQVGLAPGVVVGQLQHTREIGFERLNKAKRRLDWSFQAAI